MTLTRNVADNVDPAGSDPTKVQERAPVPATAGATTVQLVMPAVSVYPSDRNVVLAGTVSLNTIPDSAALVVLMKVKSYSSVSPGFAVLTVTPVVWPCVIFFTALSKPLPADTTVVTELDTTEIGPGSAATAVFTYDPAVAVVVSNVQVIAALTGNVVIDTRNSSGPLTN